VGDSKRIDAGDPPIAPENTGMWKCFNDSGIRKLFPLYNSYTQQVTGHPGVFRGTIIYLIFINLHTSVGLSIMNTNELKEKGFIYNNNKNYWQRYWSTNKERECVLEIYIEEGNCHSHRIIDEEDNIMWMLRSC